MTIFAMKYLIYHIMQEVETTYDKIVSLGLRYKQYRKALGISQREVHVKSGVAMSTISLFENGKGQGLSLSHFSLMMEVLNLDIDISALIPEAHRSNLAKIWEQQNKGGNK